ncbi:hypothetical protein [Brevundimonas sp. NIBR11]|uniref:hypothetical protein n=1 Tax=Brevundimonas sp. NIBR11 TaxID=3015999 RepID=UPI0022F0E0C7|nr:hypothetical protein [Brevundimonas sp. NIBR11]WGM30020.1 hypothetical protein KKHFBJBL_00235 [Brevundimonas sp. NIBR11]
MLRTALIITALLAAAPALAQTTRSPSGTGQRADPSREVICRNQAVTGSRFTHRRCRTREQEAIAQREAQRFVSDSTRSGPSVEELVNPMERSWVPQ